MYFLIFNCRRSCPAPLRMALLCCALVAIFGPLCSGADGLRFASYYGSHMVLQGAPERAVVWGYGAEGEQVSVSLLGPQPQTTATVTVTQGIWRVTLDPCEPGGPYIVMASMNNLTANLTDVLFGDVWLCGGQSNMCFETYKVLKAAEELLLPAQYPNVRVFMAAKQQSPTELKDLAQVQQPWSVASTESIRGFSAVCWIFGRLTYASQQHPVGLVQSCWGGTLIEAWSSQRALHTCGLDDNSFLLKDLGNSVLWNAMIHPFLTMTIKGAIWYQGESNTLHNMDAYNCSFPTMIDDWRSSFHKGSGAQTAQDFPFGFVQLAPVDIDHPSYVKGSTASIRWHQTADTGSAPNPRMNRTFMSVAMDLPDDMSPYHSIHPRDKLTVAQRLSLGARAVAYGEKDVLFLGPYPQGMTHTNQSLNITYDRPINVTMSGGGFEICCLDVAAPCSLESPWSLAPLEAWSSTSVQLSTVACPSDQGVGAVRYSWRDRPCEYKACPVHGAEEGDLPAPPFTITL